MKTRLQQIREAQGLSQTKLAELSGVSRNWISRIEKGNANPGIKMVCKLATALGVSLDELIQCECNKN